MRAWICSPDSNTFIGDPPWNRRHYSDGRTDERRGSGPRGRAPPWTASIRRRALEADAHSELRLPARAQVVGGALGEGRAGQGRDVVDGLAAGGVQPRVADGRDVLVGREREAALAAVDQVQEVQ